MISSYQCSNSRSISQDNASYCHPYQWGCRINLLEHFKTSSVENKTCAATAEIFNLSLNKLISIHCHYHGGKKGSTRIDAGPFCYLPCSPASHDKMQTRDRRKENKSNLKWKQIKFDKLNKMLKHDRKHHMKTQEHIKSSSNPHPLLFWGWTKNRVSQLNYSPLLFTYFDQTRLMWVRGICKGRSDVAALPLNYSKLGSIETHI